MTVTEFKIDKVSGIFVPVDAKIRPVKFGFRAPEPEVVETEKVPVKV